MGLCKLFFLKKSTITYKYGFCKDEVCLFQELMLDSAKTRNVIEATNKPGLLEKMEDLQKRSVLYFKIVLSKDFDI